MNPSKIPAPGPYEVAIVIDEEGKARGGRGERWILIKNPDGAIATVYPALNGEATAKVLAAADLIPELLESLQDMTAFSRVYVGDDPGGIRLVAKSTALIMLLQEKLG
jgi:hypothetical protein